MVLVIMMMKRYRKSLGLIGQSLWILVMSVILFSCNSNKKKIKPEDFVISGKLNNHQGLVLYLDRFGHGIENKVDSSLIDKEGNFVLHGYTDSPDIFVLYTDQSNYTYLLIDQKEKIQLSGDALQLDLGLNINGSTGSLQLLNLKLKHKILQDTFDSLQLLVASEKRGGNSEQDIHQQADSLLKDHVQFLHQFIDSNPNSLASIAALYQKIGQQRLITYQDHPAYFNKVDENLIRTYPHNYHVKDFHSKFLKLQAQSRYEKINTSLIGIGSQAPDIQHHNPKGDLLSLSELKGKYVLLDFWASWCSPCRKESPFLVAAYNQFHSKGFEIFQVSLDKQHDKWLEAIEEDELNWPYHVSDLKYWNSEPAQLYRVSSIPSNFLIDPNGIVIDKNLRGESLINKLTELLN